jgi:hypothetical protein
MIHCRCCPHWLEIKNPDAPAMKRIEDGAW